METSRGSEVVLFSSECRDAVMVTYAMKGVRGFAGFLLVIMLTGCMGTPEGEIDVGASDDYDSQLAELDLVATTFSEAFGKEFFMDNGETWSTEEYRNEFGPRPCYSQTMFNTAVHVTASHEGLTVEDFERTTRESAEQLGFDNVGELGEVRFSENLVSLSGSLEGGRGLTVYRSDDSVRLVYTTPCSTEETLREAYEAMD